MHRTVARLLVVLAVGASLVVPQVGGSVAQAQVVTTGRPASDPASAGHVSGLSWSSGVFPQDNDGAKAAVFGEDRGAPVDNIVVFPARETWRNMLSRFWYDAVPPYFRSSRDDLVVALPLWPYDHSVDDTGTARQWHRLGRNIARLDPDAYIRLAWEMNLRGHWALTPANHERWIRAWRRAADLLQDSCPRCRMVWNVNAGRGQTGVNARKAMLEVIRRVDVYAVDSYDSFPPFSDGGGAREHLSGYGRLGESWRFARRHGLPFAVPEWGVACDTAGCQWRGNAGGDDPAYVTAYVDFFREHASTLAFEAYFDEPTPNIRSALYTDPIGPRAGRAYREALAAARD